MSSRAAARLEALGFGDVHDYVGGKKAWVAAGLPTEGERSDNKRSGDLARRDPPTCRPVDRVGDVKELSDFDSWGVCVVTDEDQVVHGLLTASEVAESPSEARVDTVMALGPTTIRPSRAIDSARERMDQLAVDSLLVTTEFGELLGILFREDVSEVG